MEMNSGGKIQVAGMDAISQINSRQVFYETLNELNTRMMLLAASNLADFMNRILEMVNKLGFAECSFTRLFAESNPDAHLVTTHVNIIDHYRSREVWMHDIMIGAARNSAGTRFQSELDSFVLSSPADTDSILSNKISIKLKQSLNYFEYLGIALPARNNNGNILMAIQSPDMAAKEFRIRAEICMPSLLILAAAIDHVGTKRFPEFFLGPKESRAITINPKPLQLLTKLASENKKLKVVAAEMGITESTANDHMAAVKKALGATTQASAVYLAIKEGLIDSPWQSY